MEGKYLYKPAYRKSIDTSLKRNAVSAMGNQSFLTNYYVHAYDVIQRVYKDDGSLETSRSKASSSDVLYKGATSVIPDNQKYTTYHHIIPMNILTAYWNKLISFEKSADIKTMMGSIIANIKKNITADEDENNKAFKHISKEEYLSGRNTFKILKTNVSNIGLPTVIEDNKEEGGPKDAMDDIVSFYQWLPGNLVLGPNAGKRPNDGKDGFDYEAAYAREKPGENQIKYLELYGKIVEFNGLAAFDEVKSNAINETLKELSRLVVYIPAPELWILNDDKWTFKDYNKSEVN